MQVILNVNIVLDSEKENVGAVQQLLADLAGATVTSGNAVQDPAVIGSIGSTGRATPVTSAGTPAVGLTDNGVTAGEPGSLDPSTTRPLAQEGKILHKRGKKAAAPLATPTSADPAQLDTIGAVVAAKAAADDVVKYTKKNVEDAIVNLARKKSTNAAIDMVARFGVQRVSDLAETSYPDIMRAIEEELAK